MLTIEQNDRPTRVEGDSPMGRLLRLYWHPIAASAELIERPTKAIRVFGEEGRGARMALDLIASTPPYHRWVVHRRAVVRLLDGSTVRCGTRTTRRVLVQREPGGRWAAGIVASSGHRVEARRLRYGVALTI